MAVTVGLIVGVAVKGGVGVGVNGGVGVVAGTTGVVGVPTISEGSKMIISV